MHGYEKQFILQAVHMIVDGRLGMDWKEGKKSSRLVFIGENLNKVKLTSEFLSCCYSTSNM